MSQLSDPHPDVRVSLVFSNHFSQGNSIKELISGVTERVVVGVLNEGNETIVIKNFAGALITVQQ